MEEQYGAGPSQGSDRRGDSISLTGEEIPCALRRKSRDESSMILWEPLIIITGLDHSVAFTLQEFAYHIPETLMTFENKNTCHTHLPVKR
jgi:hypothetical protein